jgi:CelD/BcsL family acetyltransferase involved in cellulose biosynthesis
LNSINLLQSEWQFLETACPEDFTYYQSFNWCFEYYKQFADDLTDKHCPIPQVFVLRKNNTPAMIWPMMQIQSRTGLKILTSATEPLGQYCNLLFDASNFNEKIGQAVLQAILKNSNSDSVSFNNYPEDCLIEKIIGEQGIRENSNLKSAILDMGQYESWEAYNQTLSKGQRKERRRNKNKLEAQGNLAYEIHRAGSEEYKSLVHSALKMKTQWLVETGRKPGILADECTEDMLCNLKAANENELNGMYDPGKQILFLPGCN